VLSLAIDDSEVLTSQFLQQLPQKKPWSSRFDDRDISQIVAAVGL